MSIANFPSRQIGDYVITAVSDGYLSASLTLLSNIDPDDASAMQIAAGAHPPDAVHINGYLVRGRGRTVLIDAGAGGFKQWGGRLPAALAEAGVDPAAIDTVLLTHAHPDHVGGLLDADGHARFANAALIVNDREVAFWQDDGHLSRAAERARGNFLLARQVFDVYRPQLRTIREGEVLPGIFAMPLPGHSAGHTGYRFESGAQSLLVWGDVVHFPRIQIARPQVSIAFDHDPALSAATRARLLDVAATEGLCIAGMHLGEAGFAHIQKEGRDFVLVDAC
ncbi:MAG: MBL fold metallo-hydrolase [Paludibacterium sp.]|uniref:MBL fold metallo-hydrolase n=1 Tax=Paludibacterium sp. TaxID=1917523 RepID=UPI0025F7330C|nr:MBL fold metallo-hydrolase [Paludibacterium sp.]MBV8046217.1 MBL fold metallo-hydrolase [Paludibacterium sp.]MBV8646927.1 MBL fold metallo-hydrolase [Paludibacterium sp.]